MKNPQKIHSTPENLVNRPPEEQTTKDTTEIPKKTAREIMLDFLIERNFLTKEETALVSPDKIDELIIRTAHEYKKIPNEIPKSSFNKVRRILGLQPDLGEGKINTSERNGEIKKLIEEMRSYLEKFRSQCPEVLGMILCGSRMDPDKLPDLNSDMDTVLILKKGTVTDPRTPEGEALLYRLRAFSDNTPTNSSFPVELDELYSTDDLFKKLQNPNDKNKITWGWNPNIIKYIGDDIGDLDELGVQIKILEGINHPDMLKLKKQKIAEAKKMIIRYLERQTKKSKK